MKKRILLFIVCLSLLVFTLAGTSYAWQGRMEGAGDPYGLLSDESDFLIHPAKIAKGEGVRFYGDYRFTYTGVLDWDHEVDIFTPAGVLVGVIPRETSGDELRNEVLVGSSFPVWLGRMGLFFTYSGMRGDYDGKDTELWLPATYIYNTYDLKSDLDNFAFSLLYGLPVGGGFKLGGEVQLAYRQEENKAVFNQDMGGSLYTNYYIGTLETSAGTFFFMLPYDSKYWEALFKGSLEGKVGPLDLEFTLRGGFDFAGDNTYEYEYQVPIGTPIAGFRLKGDVKGWRIGGDLWARYALKDGLTLPLLVRVDYQDKTRDGDGPGALILAGDNFTYESREQSLCITVGGGLDKELAKGAKIAGGIYYNYLRGNKAIQFTDFYTGGWDNRDSSDIPSSTEHQVMLRLAGELALSPAITLRMGLAPFFGWVQEDFKVTVSYGPPPGYVADDASSDGYHWGIGASLGGTIQFKPITLEPFVNFNYQQSNLDGDGNRIFNGMLMDLLTMDRSRSQWSIGGGLSILYDL